MIRDEEEFTQSLEQDLKDISDEDRYGGSQEAEDRGGLRALPGRKPCFGRVTAHSVVGTSVTELDEACDFGPDGGLPEVDREDAEAGADLGDDLCPKGAAGAHLDRLGIAYHGGIDARLPQGAVRLSVRRRSITQR